MHACTFLTTFFGTWSHMKDGIVIIKCLVMVKNTHTKIPQQPKSEAFMLKSTDTVFLPFVFRGII